MSILLTNEDDTIEDEGKIIEEVEQFYTILCTSEGSSLEVLAAREEFVGYVSTSVSEEQHWKIEVVPIGEEVKSILKQLPKSKVPRIDGMMVEVLLACWSFL